LSPTTAEDLLQRYATGERNFRDADLPRGCLAGANLRGSDLNAADLVSADLTDAVLIDANLCDADLRRAVLRGATLRGSRLSGADLSGADLTGADLEGADIRHADFSEASLRAAKLVAVIRNRSTNLDNSDFDQIVCDPDLNRHLLRRATRGERFAGNFGKFSRWIMVVLVVSAAAILGGIFGLLLAMLVGTIVGSAKGDHTWINVCSPCGMVVAGGLALWKIVKPRAMK
jgi:uncharacterized protein YjbI with pentapeptide repeats